MMICTEYDQLEQDWEAVDCEFQIAQAAHCPLMMNGNLAARRDAQSAIRLAHKKRAACEVALRLHQANHGKKALAASA
jgi:hypothetical protein